MKSKEAKNLSIKSTEATGNHMECMNASGKKILGTSKLKQIQDPSWLAWGILPEEREDCEELETSQWELVGQVRWPRDK